MTAKVIGHLRFQRLLNQQFSQLLEQPVLANQVCRLLVISQQAVQQCLGYCFLSYGHHRSWQWGSFLPGDRLHKNSYTLDQGKLRQASADVITKQLYALLEAELLDRFLFQFPDEITAEEIRVFTARAIKVFMAAYGPLS